MSADHVDTDVARIVLLGAKFSDERRHGDLVELFTDDGVLDVGAKVVEGKAAIAEFFGNPKPVEGLQRTKHVVTNQLVERTGESTASVSSYFQVIRGAAIQSWGRYLDDLALVGGTWRITRRRVVAEGPPQEG